MRSAVITSLVVLVSLSIAAVVSAQTAPTGDPARPAYQPQRSEEDWSFLDDTLPGADRWDPIKFIPLRSDRKWYMTLGGEFRPFFEFYDNYNWGAGPEDHNGYLSPARHVSRGRADGRRARAFVELKSGVETGRVGGPRPPDEDRLDVNQAFIDIRVGAREKRRLTFRLGRHEMNYGDGSLVSYREGPNVRQGYDGPKVMVRLARVAGRFLRGQARRNRSWSVRRWVEQSPGVLGRLRFGAGTGSRHPRTTRGVLPWPEARGRSLRPGGRSRNTPYCRGARGISERPAMSTGWKGRFNLARSARELFARGSTCRYTPTRSIAPGYARGSG